ncbi:histidine kinase dimerization/phospho-acceptor domain-containing protein (plasmid) [Deinococcus radiomollis]|uniref:histidine kinase dimerization/phospho-acceptor domain-containing protein n=1 Tax=Deinococcus radiomollis TaxID=468916 RepID=UPI003892BAFB
MLGDGAALYYEPKDDRWHNRVQHGSLHAPELQAAIDAGLSYADTNNLLIPWTSGQPYFQEMYDQNTDQLPSLVGNIGATAALPLRVGDIPLGVMVFALFQGRTWSNEDRMLLEAAMQSLELALDRAQQTRIVMGQRDALNARTQELAASNQELQAFSYSVSHDLRTPVRHMLGFLRLAQRSLDGRLDERSARYLDVVEQAGEQMNTLIDAMLDLARAVQEPLRPTTVELNTVMAQIQETLVPDLLSRNVQWEVAPLPSVRGDRDALRQVLSQLTENADAVENARELVIGSFDLYMAGTARRTNEAVQILTIVTVSLGIIGAVAGVMGTNFSVGFFKAGATGFIVMLVGMLLLIAVVLLFARRRCWI